ncbi:hypothetical protein ACFL3H_08940, partial [Gemmatimonadota bacterium]
VGEKHKVVDFLVDCGSARVLIDAKGVDLAILGKVTFDPDVLARRTKNSVLKGVEQGLEVADRLPDRRPTYLLLVTYKELYLGNGQRFFSAVGKEEYQSLAQKHDASTWIPPEHIYIVSVQSFEFLVECIRNGLNLADTLRNAVSRDMQGMTMGKFVFSQHLEEEVKCFKGEVPKFMQDEFQRLGVALKSAFEA